MRQPSVATRSLRRRRPASRVATGARSQAALQIFVFRGDSFLGTEMFAPGRPIAVGRHRDAQLRLDGETVSRYHARISVSGDAVFVEDLDSGNGTFVNRSRARGRTRIAGTDHVHVGAFTLRVKLLTAPGPRPYDPAKSEDTTKINAILASERTGGTDEVLVEAQPGLGEALYREAIRRTTGAERAAAPGKPRLAAPMEDDSTQMRAEDMVPGAPTPSAPIGLAPEVERRLEDLDALIASLEAEDRGDSMLPWRGEETAPTTTELDSSEGFDASEPPRILDTQEFARDLASRLALDGNVLGDPIPERPAAQVIPLRPPSPTPVPTEALDDEDATEAEDLDIEVDAALAAAAELDDENPETELLPGDLPPEVAPLPEVQPQAAIHGEPTRPVARPKGLAYAPRSEAPPAAPPPKPAGPRRCHEARLMTPTSLRVDVSPKAPAPRDDSALLDEVWTRGDEAGPSASVLRHTVDRQPARPAASVTGARPKDRIDGFSTQGTAPAAPPRPSFAGVEVSARIGGQLVDIAALRKGGEEYILGHRTPQGAVAPARAHVGLRLVRINADRTIDLVFPRDVGGHLVRGDVTVTFSELAEGRKYSCLRLEAGDVATVVLGGGRDAVTYHIRFLRRPTVLR